MSAFRSRAEMTAAIDALPPPDPATDPTTAAPATPGQDDMRRERAILRWAADRLDDPWKWADPLGRWTAEQAEAASTQRRYMLDRLRRWADELDATPGVYQLPAEPPRAELAAIDNALRNGSYMTGANLALDLLCDQLGVDREGLVFDPLWAQSSGGPLSTTPPAGTEGEHHAE